MSTVFDIDTVVIGAGVVGLSVARELVAEGRDVWVLEQSERPGEGVSSRNSGVIHAGLYYPTGSLKAQLCVRGRDLMYEFCTRGGVPHLRCGKLVVAVGEAERAALQALQCQSLANGVDDVELIDGSEAMRREPALRCAAALDSPSSGVVDVPEFVMALVGEVERGDSRVLCEVRVDAVHVETEGFRIDTARGESLRCRSLVNAAGLEATAFARRIEGLDPSHVPQVHYAAGHYYALRGRAPFSRLIYPMPERSGLGVHLGFDLGGRSRFGPDVRWMDAPDYDFDDSRREDFVDGIARWWPGLDPERLSPDFVGVRPKLSGPGEHAADFVLQFEDVHGVPGLVNLFGIDSPGLTSSLGIGEAVRQRMVR